MFFREKKKEKKMQGWAIPPIAIRKSCSKVNFGYSQHMLARLKRRSKGNTNIWKNKMINKIQ